MTRHKVYRVYDKNFKYRRGKIYLWCTAGEMAFPFIEVGNTEEQNLGTKSRNTDKNMTSG